MIKLSSLNFSWDQTRICCRCILYQAKYIGALKDISSALQLSSDAKKAINKYLSDTNNKDLDPNGAELRQALVDLYGTNGTNGAKTGKIGALETALETVFRRKYESAQGKKGTTDPPLFYLTQFTERYNQKRFGLNNLTTKSGYVSLAKLFTIFMGESLAASGRFDEVQFLFYAFNHVTYFFLK